MDIFTNPHKFIIFNELRDSEKGNGLPGDVDN